MRLTSRVFLCKKFAISVPYLRIMEAPRTISENEIMSLMKALFTPIMPPKNYSFEKRNFETEYEEMKRQYLKKQRQNGTSASAFENDSQVPLSWRLR